MNLTVSLTKLYCDHNLLLTECSECGQELALGHEVPVNSVTIGEQSVEYSVQPDGPGWVTLEQGGEENASSHCSQ